MVAAGKVVELATTWPEAGDQEEVGMGLGPGGSNSQSVSVGPRKAIAVGIIAAVAHRSVLCTY